MHTSSGGSGTFEYCVCKVQRVEGRNDGKGKSFDLPGSHLNSFPSPSKINSEWILGTIDRQTDREKTHQTEENIIMHAYTYHQTYLFGRQKIRKVDVDCVLF